MIYYCIIVLLLTLYYMGLQTYYLKGWQSLPLWNIPKNYQPKTFISILIPARNEADNITHCIDSILNQRYPSSLFEILVIDDHSTDDTATLVKNYNLSNVHCLALADYVDRAKIQSFKKKAIEIALTQAKGELIVGTDADCITQKDWLALLASFYEQKDLKFIAAPVNFYQEQTTFERFQSLDFMGMMGITGSGIHTQLMHMCNGANMAYTKSAFDAVGGFEGTEQFASGDDMMLLHKIAKRYPNQIGFLKNQSATVFTKAKSTLKGFINQRVRWSTKSGSYEEKQVTLLLALVWFFCLSIPLTFLLAFWGGIYFVYLGLFQLACKAIVDYPLLSQTSKFFNRKEMMQVFGIASIYHLLYIIVVGFLGGVVKNYEWKGRRVR